MHHRENSMQAMSMTFQPWNQYKIKLLFEAWDIDCLWKFRLSCIAVSSAVVLWHALKHINLMLEHFIRSQNRANCSVVGIFFANNQHKDHSLIRSERGFALLLVCHAFIVSLSYMLSMMIMLVAMSFNLSLLLALFVGYFLGDFFFYYIGLRYQTNPATLVLFLRHLTHDLVSQEITAFSERSLHRVASYTILIRCTTIQSPGS